MSRHTWKSRLIFCIATTATIGSVSATIVFLIKKDRGNKKAMSQEKVQTPGVVKTSTPIDTLNVPPVEVDEEPIVAQPIVENIEQVIDETPPPPILTRHFPMLQLLPSHRPMLRLLPAQVREELPVSVSGGDAAASELYVSPLEEKFDEYKLFSTRIPGLLTQLEDSLSVPFLETPPVIQEALESWDTPETIDVKIRDLRRYKTKVEQHNDAVLDIANKRFIFGDSSFEQKNNDLPRTFDDSTGLQSLANPPMFINNHWYNMTDKYLYKDNEIIFRFDSKVFTNYMVDNGNNWYLWNNKQILKNGQEMFGPGLSAPFLLEATLVSIKGEWAATASNIATRTMGTAGRNPMRVLNPSGVRVDRVLQSNLGNLYQINNEQRRIQRFFSPQQLILDSDEIDNIVVLENRNNDTYFCTPKRIIKNGELFAKLSENDSSFDNFIMDENNGDIYYKINTKTNQHYFKKNTDILIDDQAVKHNYLVMPNRILMIDKLGKWIGIKDRYVIKEGVYYFDTKRDSEISHVYELQ